jgi:hypothetical protein
MSKAKPNSAWWQEFTLPLPDGHGSVIPSEPGYPLGPSASTNIA